MQTVFMRRWSRAAMIAAVVLALGAVLAFVLLSGGAPPAQAAADRHHAKVARHVGHHARKSSTADPSGTTDPDNVQSGDQSTPDTPGETSGESSETSGEAPGNVQPSGGGADFQGECTGDCVQ